MSSIAIYVRVSTTDKGQDTAMQVTACKAWLRSQGKNEDDYIKYEDKLSGRKSSRPEYQRMLEDVRKGRIKIIVAYKLDRLSRSLQDLLKFSNVLKECEATFVIATQPELNGEKQSALSIMLFQLLGVFAEFESNLIAERIRSGMAEGKKNGKRYGGDQNSILKRVAKLADELEPNVRTGKRWSLLKIREKLKLDRNKFYSAVQFLERERGELITDYSDERYMASVRGFQQKRVDRHGKYLDSNDPKLNATIEKKEQAVDLDVENLEEYIKKLDNSEATKSFVNFSLRNIQTKPRGIVAIKIKSRAEIEAEKSKEPA